MLMLRRKICGAPAGCGYDSNCYPSKADPQMRSKYRRSFHLVHHSAVLIVYCLTMPTPLISLSHRDGFSGYCQGLGIKWFSLGDVL
jgi:hypothetical protein